MEYVEQHRLACLPYRDKVMSAHDAASLIKDGARVGISGFSHAGDAEEVLLALANQVEAGRKCRIELLTGASVSSRLEARLAGQHLLRRQIPFQSEPRLRQAINSGSVQYLDLHLGEMPVKLRRGELGPVDFAIVEAAAVLPDGSIVPTTSVGNSPLYVEKAVQVIIELNQAQPLELVGMHDIYPTKRLVTDASLSFKDPGSRIGSIQIPVDPGKVVAVVPTNNHDEPEPLRSPDEDMRRMAGYLREFLESEVVQGRLNATLAPLQAGVGTLANAVFAGLQESRFTSLEVYSEVIQDAMMEMLEEGRIKVASGSALTLSARGQHYLSELKRFADRLILRPQEVSNHPEVIRRLGVIAINTALEVSIYAQANSTHLGGSQIVNGIGGSGDFARNAALAVFVCKSTAAGGNISRIVPMVPHVDHPWQDVDVVVTEQGLADLRNLSPRQRAEKLIATCAHPRFRDALSDYYHRACRVGGHTPHLLNEALSWHARWQNTGDMLPI